MTAEALVAAAEAAGLQLQPKPDGKLHVVPRDRLTPDLRAALVASKADVLAYLRGRSLGVEWSRVSLYQLDRVLEVEVPWADYRLVIAPGCRIARELRAQDALPGRVWCVCGVLDLLLSGVTPEDVRKIAETRLVLDAEQLEIRKKDPGCRSTQEGEAQ